MTKEEIEQFRRQSRERQKSYLELLNNCPKLYPIAKPMPVYVPIVLALAFSASIVITAGIIGYYGG